MRLKVRYQDPDGTWREYEAFIPQQVRGIDDISDYAARVFGSRYAKAKGMTNQEAINKYIFRQRELIKQDLYEKVLNRRGKA